MKRLMVFGTVTATFMLPAARTAAAQNLDGAFMFRGEARRGQWGILGADVGGGSVFTASATDVTQSGAVFTLAFHWGEK